MTFHVPFFFPPFLFLHRCTRFPLYTLSHTTSAPPSSHHPRRPHRHRREARRGRVRVEHQVGVEGEEPPQPLEEAPGVVRRALLACVCVICVGWSRKERQRDGRLIF